MTAQGQAQLLSLGQHDKPGTAPDKSRDSAASQGRAEDKPNGATSSGTSSEFGTDAKEQPSVEGLDSEWSRTVFLSYSL